MWKSKAAYRWLNCWKVRPPKSTGRTESILRSGIRQGGKFIMREANNLPPCVPLENLQAMYSATRQVGVFTK